MPFLPCCFLVQMERKDAKRIGLTVFLLAFLANSYLCLADERPFQPLHRVDETIVQATGGVCLDGTPPGYYMRPPKNASIHSWRIHLQGGGWCVTVEDCWRRSKTGLGSSALWPEKVDDAVFGFLSSDETVNPRFADWGAVFVKYCDGSSFMSDRDKPVTELGNPLYFRGKRALQAVLQDLERQAKLLSTAVEVILSGTSAGGLATFLHADTFPDFFGSSTRFAFLPDAGVFLDHKNMAHTYSYREEIINGLALWNATGSLNPACVEEWKAEGKEWHCLFARSVFRHFKSKEKFFVLNSQYDKANIDAILQLHCNPDVTGSCSPEQLEALQEYRNSMRDALTEMCADGLHALFASSCFQHEESCQNSDWTQLTVNNVTLSQAVHSWYFDDKPSIYLDSVSWPNNESCVKNITHGPC